MARCDTIINFAVSKKYEEFLDHPRDFKLIKKGYAPWNHSFIQSVSRSVRPLVTKLDGLKDKLVDIMAYMNIRLYDTGNTLFCLLISS